MLTSPPTRVQKLGKPIASFQGNGLTSRRTVEVNLYSAKKGEGINFILPQPACNTRDGQIVVKAIADNVISTTRNTALGIGKQRVCFVEHILCAIALCNIEDVYIEVLGAELPMGNGSCDFWFDLFVKNGLQNKLPKPAYKITEPIVIDYGKRSLIAYPAERFSCTYLMDFNHPKVGRIWRRWSTDEDLREITDARTFGSLPEHQLLGFEKDVVSYTKDDFTMPLRSPDEPVRHKLLDLIGDLILAGVNPLSVKASFVSIKGGHEIDVEMAKKLAKAIKPL